MKFIDFAEQNRILLAFLPPHSTHRLQPLDVGLFSPLAHFYTQEIDKLLFESQGLTHITKRHFWRLFSVAWQKAFSPSNINSAFKATGLKPWDPQRILAFFQRPVLPPPPPMAPRTPQDLRTLRHQIKALHRVRGINSPLSHVIRAAEIFATENEILRHENNGLRIAIKEEKRRRKRGKPLGLMDEEDIQG
jgi:DDE superfamily endonuclease